MSDEPITGPWGWADAYSRQSAQEIGLDRMMRKPNLVPTGISSIDSCFYNWGCREGIPRGEYVVVGGASNAGKTQFGLWLVKQAAIRGERAAVFSLEMRREDILLRLHQATTNIPSARWSPKDWQAADGQKLVRDVLTYRGQQLKADVLVNAGYDSELRSVLAEIRSVIEQGVKFVMVDHLQLIRVDGYGDDQIATRAEMVSESLRRMALEHEVTIVGLSQLNRGASREKNRTPTIHDLWGGTSMESNPSIILLLDHSRYEPDITNGAIARTWLILGKNRMGPKGLEVPIKWDHAHLHLSEGKADEEHEWPQHSKVA